MRRVAFAACVLWLALAGTASADDCSSPPDCSNTAWTVGGAAAAAAAVLAAAVANWLPKHPEEGLSEECRAALQALLDRINATIRKMSELAVAEEGANRKALEAFAESIAEMQTVAALQAELGLPTAVGGAAGVGGPGADAAGWTPAAATALLAKLAKDRSDEATARALSAMMAMRRLANVPGGRGMILRGAAPRVLGPPVSAAQQSAGAMRARMAYLSGPLARIGQGLGVLSLVANAADQISGRRRQELLRQMGDHMSRAEIKDMESQRWTDYANELGGRIDKLRGSVDRQVAAYNAKARECKAKPLEPPDDLVGRMRRTAAGQQAGGSGPVPRSLLDTPRPLGPEDETEGCGEKAAAAYRADLARFDGELKAMHRSRREYDKWNQRYQDLWASSQAARTALVLAEREFNAQQGMWNWGSGSGAILTLMALGPVGWKAALVLGVSSVVVGQIGSAYAPGDEQTLALGEANRRIEFIESRGSYVVSEMGRHRAEWEQHEDTVRAVRRRLEQAHARCAGEPGFTPPPEDPGYYLPKDVTGQVRNYKEIGTWR